MIVIGVVGYPASGKGEFSKISLKLGFTVVSMGDIIRQRVTQSGYSLTEKNIGREAKNIRVEYGMNAVAVLTVEKIKKYHQESEIVVIDGIRGDSEIQYFRSVFPHFIVVSIVSSFNIRLSRMQYRVSVRDDITITEKSLKHRDAREKKFGLNRAMKLADVRLVNESTRDAYESQIYKFYDSILLK
ncbi:MAG TPA: AAA family ATPase [Methanocorpusculum sp.]|nr:AAA family ATPase [Methanocorpusculum sp.]